MTLFGKVCRAYFSELILNTRRKILLIFSARRTTTLTSWHGNFSVTCNKCYATVHVILCIRLSINKNRFFWIRHQLVMNFAIVKCGQHVVILLSLFFLVGPLLLVPIHCRCRGYCRNWSLTMTHKHSVGLPWTRDRPFAEASTCTSQYSQETNIHAPGEMRTRNPSKWAAADLRLRPRGYRDRLNFCLMWL